MAKIRASITTHQFFTLELSVMFTLHDSNNTQGYITQTGYSHLTLRCLNSVDWNGALDWMLDWTAGLDFGLHAHIYLPTSSTLQNH